MTWLRSRSKPSGADSTASWSATHRARAVGRRGRAAGQPQGLLSAIAAADDRIRLVAGALISPLRHPLVPAKDLATLDRLSHGRLVVQPTVSWHCDEYDALGVPFASRGAILDEQLDVWSLAWAGSPVTFDGRHYRFADVWVEPQPFRLPGAWRRLPQATRSASEYAATGPGSARRGP